MDFRERVVLVTGAASGIGRALCHQLGRAGARLGLVDRDEAGLERFHSELKTAGVPTALAAADVRKRETVRSAVALLTDRLGPVDVLIPCAGICGFEVVDDLNVPQVENILQINFLGVVYAIDAVLPSMLQRRRGVVVTTIFPGFVRTPLLDGLMAAGQTRLPPGAIDADTCAAKILAAVRRGKRVASFPWSTSWLVSLARFAPPLLYDRIMTRMAARIKLPY